MTGRAHTRVDVRLGERSYPVYVGSGLLERLGALALEAGLGKRALVITNETVGDLYGPLVLKSLHRSGIAAHYATIPDGEQYKSLETVASLYDACVDAKLDRGSFIVALGGGVIGDIAGFTAATYMRGIDYVQVPTTLLAQVDASVGGKTGVNHAAAKNLIGAFHQPRLVLADISTLVSLPQREYRSGLAEVVKHGLIQDRAFFEFLEGEWFDLLAVKEHAVAHAVVRSVEIKGAVVASDERESGLRAILNYGHTVGHAVEAAAGFSRLSHGESVAIGMVVEGLVSVAMGLLSQGEFARAEALLKRLGLPTAPGDVALDEVLAAMDKDKKVLDGTWRLALLEGIGSAKVVAGVPRETVIRAYHQANEASRTAEGGS